MSDFNIVSLVWKGAQMLLYITSRHATANELYHPDGSGQWFETTRDDHDVSLTVFPPVTLADFASEHGTLQDLLHIWSN